MHNFTENEMWYKIKLDYKEGIINCEFENKLDWNESLH